MNISSPPGGPDGNAKIRLSRRDCTPSIPWNEFVDQHTLDEAVTGIVLWDIN